MRSSLFFLILCGWCQRRAQISLSAGEAPALVTSNLMVEGLTLLLGLKLIWITAWTLFISVVPVDEHDGNAYGSA